MLFRSLQDPALIVKLGDDDAPGHSQGELGVEGSPVLIQARQPMMVLRGQEVAKEPPVPGEELDRDAAAQDLRQGRRGEMDRLAGDHPLQIAKRNLAQEFVAILLYVPAMDLQPFAGERDPQVGLVEAGGGHQGAGVVDYWITGLLDYWITGLLDYWITGLLDYWSLVGG